MTCQEHVGDGSFLGHSCGRKVVEDGLCKLHLTVRAKRRAKQAEEQARREAQQRAEAQARARCEELAGYGITAKPEYVRSLGGSGPSGYTGQVVVDPDELLTALKGF